MSNNTLSLRGKIGLIPSLLISIPIFLIIIIVGFIIWLIAKIFKFTGMLEALEYQMNIFKKGVQRGKIATPKV